MRDLSQYPIFAQSTGSQYSNINKALLDPSMTSARIHHRKMDVASSIYTFNLISSPQIVDIATSYLGCDPLLTSIESWYVFPVRGEDLSSIYDAAAQTYHYHLDWIKFVKFFVNLTDVDESHGP